MFCDCNENEQHDGVVHGHANEDGCLQVNDRQLINFSVLGEEFVSKIDTCYSIQYNTIT